MLRSSRRGTTIVEIVAVLVLLGMLSTMAVLRMRPSPKAMVEQSARLLSQDLDQARTRAYATRALTRVTIRDTSWTLYMDQNRDTLIAENAAERTAFGGDTKRLLTTQVMFGRGAVPAIAGDTVTAAWTASSIARLQFGPRGTTEPFGASAVIYLRYSTDANAVAAVEVTPSANVRVWRWVRGAWQ